MSGNVFRFSVRKDKHKDSEKVVDMNAVEEVIELSKEAVEANKEFEKDLSALNITNNGRNGLKDFIFEQIEAVENDGQLRHVRIIDEKGLADLIIEKVANSKYAKVKCDYLPGQVDWVTFKEAADVIYLNKDNPNFEEIKSKAIKYGVKKIESTICTSQQCEELAELMQLEQKITGSAKSVFIPHVYTKS